MAYNVPAKAKKSLTSIYKTLHKWPIGRLTKRKDLLYMYSLFIMHVYNKRKKVCSSLSCQWPDVILIVCLPSGCSDNRNLQWKGYQTNMVRIFSTWQEVCRSDVEDSPECLWLCETTLENTFWWNVSAAD